MPTKKIAPEVSTFGDTLRSGTFFSIRVNGHERTNVWATDAGEACFIARLMYNLLPADVVRAKAEA
jgi:hypothetical protein